MGLLSRIGYKLGEVNWGSGITVGLHYSTFSSLVLRQEAGIGKVPHSRTTEINAFKLDFVDSFERIDFDVSFINTPSFDTNKSDVEIS